MDFKKIIKYNCIGCGLCSSVLKFDFYLDKNGFNRPIIPNEFDNKKIEEICPIFFNKDEKIYGFSQKGLEFFQGYSNDESVRYKSSSGGIISALLIYLLENKVVDGVIQIRVSEDDFLKNSAFVSHNKEDVLKCCGSRYAPASPLQNLNRILNDQKKYAFVGKPCDVRALKKFLLINPKFKNKFIFCISFFCAGTPSLNATYELIDKMGSCTSQMHSLKYRGEGWPGKATIIEKNGNHKFMNYEESWEKILGRKKEQFCRICPIGMGEYADITCGDYWDLDSNMKPTFEEKDGKNVIVARTISGKELMYKATKSGYITFSKIDSSELKFIQPYQYTRQATLTAQCKALKILGKYVPDYNIESLKYIRKRIKFKIRIRYFFGTCKRIIKKQIN